MSYHSCIQTTFKHTAIHSSLVESHHKYLCMFGPQGSIHNDETDVCPYPFKCCWVACYTTRYCCDHLTCIASIPAARPCPVNSSLHALRLSKSHRLHYYTTTNCCQLHNPPVCICYSAAPVRIRTYIVWNVLPLSVIDVPNFRRFLISPESTRS